MEVLMDKLKEEPGDIKYTDREIAYRTFLLNRLADAAILRDSPHTEFDDMDYLTYYETNAKAGNSYIRPKKNPFDSRIVTGTTLEKKNTLLSAIMNYNFEPDIEAHDQNDMPIYNLGNHMESMTRKSRREEDYEDKRLLIYKELLDQGTVFVEEVFCEEWRMEKELKNNDWYDGLSLSQMGWEQRLKKVYSRCEARLISGT